jgi:hypothetical protein
MVKLGGKLSENGYADALVLPLPPVCVCLSKGTLPFSSQIKVEKITFTGANGSQLDGKSIYTEEPLYIDVEGGVQLQSNTPLACDTYADRNYKWGFGRWTKYGREMGGGLATSCMADLLMKGVLTVSGGNAPELLDELGARIASQSEV